MSNSESSDPSAVNYLHSECYHEKLFQNVASLDIFLDAVLSIEGKTIRVHRLVLAAGSEYFCDLLKRNQGLGTCPIFVFVGIKFEHMMCIVQYLYTGKTQVAPNELEDFINVAKRLKVLGFCDEDNPINIDTSLSFERTPPCSRPMEPKSEVISDDSDDESLAVRVGQKTPMKRRRDRNGNAGSPASRASGSELSTLSYAVPRIRKRARTNDNVNGLSDDVRMTTPPTTIEIDRLTLHPSDSVIVGASALENEASTSNTIPRIETDNQTARQNGNDSESEGGSVYSCCSEGCTQTFPTVLALLTHRKQKWGGEKFRCDRCKKTFALRIALTHHTNRSLCRNSNDFQEDDTQMTQ